MSILNVSLLGDHALVAVDTLAVRSTSGFRAEEQSKLFPLVHADCVVAGRGLVVLSLLAYQAVAKTTDTHYDLLAEALPSVVQEALGWLQQAHPEALVDARIGGHEVALVGWSRSREQMSGTVVKLTLDRQGGEHFETEAVDEWLFAPGDTFRSDLNLPRAKSTQDMLSLAQRQAKWHAERVPGIPPSKRLIVAELTKDLMSITSRSL